MEGVVASVGWAGFAQNSIKITSPHSVKFTRKSIVKFSFRRLERTMICGVYIVLYTPEKCGYNIFLNKCSGIRRFYTLQAIVQSTCVLEMMKSQYPWFDLGVAKIRY